MTAPPCITVVGAGVIGLTCALRLLEKGYAVDVRAKEGPLDTTSAVAGGYWYPYLAYPFEKVEAWSAEAYVVFAGLAETAPESGVRMVHGTERTGRPAAEMGPEVLWWTRPLTDLEVVDGAISFTTPIAEMPVYLPWLAGRVEAGGGRITVSELDALPSEGIVVNCAGLGAGDLVGDASVHPVRGQIVRLEQYGLDEWAMDDRDGTTYVLPRGGDIVVGGTADHDVWDRTPDPATATEILTRASALVPGLAGRRVLEHRVGLRPARPSVRLEREGRVVHCYGHGGAGVTMSWGCASEVVRLVSEAAAESAR